MSWRIRSGTKWRGARRVTQMLAMIAVLLGPVLGGWQRGYRGTMSAWRMSDWDLPQWVIDVLPNVPSETVYHANQIMGGGTAGSYLGVPASDPVLGTVALLWGHSHLWSIVAWAIPIVLALLFGRVFCGWLCPFGTLARGLDRLLSLLPWKHRGFEIPRRRPVRWVILAVALIAGAIGGESLAVVFLPHALLQATAYSVLLLGGVGAVGGAFAGLIGAGLVFGPGLYCASICPTGATLGLLGRARIARVRVIDPGSCGSCTLCHRACWLGLTPAAGDPGPDCDLCTRCFTACPRQKMVVEIAPPRRTGIAVLLFLVVSLSMTAAWATDWDTVETVPYKPTLVLNGSHETPNFTVAVTVLDYTGAHFTLDTELEHGIELSAYVVRGPKSARGRPGHRAPDGEVFKGPLELTLRHRGAPPIDVSFAHATSPISTPRRAIYSRRLDTVLVPGDQVVVHPVEGVFREPIVFVVPDVHPGRGNGFGWLFLASLLGFGGLLSIALGAAKENR